jgi:hypothetical protein
MDHGVSDTEIHLLAELILEDIGKSKETLQRLTNSERPPERDERHRNASDAGNL